MFPETVAEDKLKDLEKENTFLNNLVKRLVLDEVESAPSRSWHRDKMPAHRQQPTVLKSSDKLGHYKFLAPTEDQTWKQEHSGPADKMLRRKLLEENLIHAVKQDPFLFARIQGLKNLQGNVYDWK